MPRAKGYECVICGKKDYKKNLFVSTVVVNDIVDEYVKRARTYKSGLLCSGECRKIWRNALEKKINEEE